MSAISTLVKFVEKHKDAFAQKSEEWLKDPRFGGSEIAALMGLNPFAKKKDIFARKLGLCNFKGNRYTFWGNMFEEVTKVYSENILKTKIFETGSLPGILSCQRYSPDGLGVVILENVDGELEEYIVLFEFKAPFGSFPPGKVPAHYAPQIQTGMASIDIVHCSIFVNNLYRKCTIDNLANKNAEYDEIFHSGDFKKRAGGAKHFPYAGGMLYFYRTEQGEIYADAEDKEDEPYWIEDERKLLRSSREWDPVDFGRSSSPFVALLSLVDKGFVRVEYSEMGFDREEMENITFFDDNQHLLDAKEDCDFITIDEVRKRARKKIEEGGMMGFLPWKLMISDVFVVNQDREWVGRLKETLESAKETLDIFMNSDNPEREFMLYYGDLDQSDDEGRVEVFKPMGRDKRLMKLSKKSG
jgi:hypothetical protein